jgi:hypothetical protein
MVDSLNRAWAFRLWAFTIVFIGIATLGVVPVHADGGRHKAFPLWLEVPAPRFAVLDEGQLPNGTRWGAYVSRFGGSDRNTMRPCITVARFTRIGEFNSALDCGRLLSAADPEHPVYASITENYRNHPGGPERSETVMSLTFDPSAARVVMALDSGGQIAMRPRLLSVRQQHKANVPALKYVALGLMRNVCVEAVRGFDGEGQEMFAASTDVCP